MKKLLLLNRRKFVKYSNIRFYCEKNASFTIQNEKTIEGKEFVRYIPNKPDKNMEGQQILFVHSEWVGKWFWEEHFMPFFAKNGIECTAFDILGHEEKLDDNIDYSGANVEDYLEDLHVVASMMGGKPIMIGHGLGSLLILKYLTIGRKKENNSEISLQIKEIREKSKVIDDKNTENSLDIQQQTNVERPEISASSVFLISTYSFATESIAPHHAKLFQNLFKLWKSALFKGFGVLRMVLGSLEDARKYYFPYDMDPSLSSSYFEKLKEEPPALIIAYYREKKLPTSKDKYRARDIHLVCGTDDKLVLPEEQELNASILGIEKSQIIYVSEGSHCIPIDPKRWESCASQILDRLYEVNSVEVTTNKILEELKFPKKKPGLKSTTIIQEEPEEDVDYLFSKEALHIGTDDIGEILVTRCQPKKDSINLEKSILFVHGEWTGSWVWEEYFMKFFAREGFDCYSFDLYENIESDLGKNIKGTNSVVGITKKISIIIDKYDISPILIGHGMGCAYIMAYLSQLPKPHDELSIFMSPPPFPLELNSMLEFTYSILSASSFRKKLSVVFNPTGTIYSPINEDSAKKFLFSKDVPRDEITSYANKMTPSSLTVYSSWKGVKYEQNKIQKPILVVGKEDILGKDAIIMKYQTFFGKDLDIISVPEVAHMMMLDARWSQAAQVLLEQIDKKYGLHIFREIYNKSNKE